MYKVTKIKTYFRMSMCNRNLRVKQYLNSSQFCVKIKLFVFLFFRNNKQKCKGWTDHWIRQKMDKVHHGAVDQWSTLVWHSNVITKSKRTFQPQLSIFWTNCPPKRVWKPFRYVIRYSINSWPSARALGAVVVGGLELGRSVNPS